jgi:hypothetical protein
MMQARRKIGTRMLGPCFVLFFDLSSVRCPSSREAVLARACAASVAWVHAPIDQIKSKELQRGKNENTQFSLALETAGIFRRTWLVVQTPNIIRHAASSLLSLVQSSMVVVRTSQVSDLCSTWESIAVG